MPAQKKKTMKAKKVMKPASRSVSRPVASRVASRSSKVHPLMKPYLVKEQAEFHKQNPSAQMLIAIFLISVVIFYVVLYMTGNLF